MPRHFRLIAQLRSAVSRVARRRSLFVLALCLTSLNALAAGSVVVTHLSGTLTARQADGTSRILAVKSEVQAGDTLTTQANTYARLKFQDGQEIVLRPNSQLAVTSYNYQLLQPENDDLSVGLVKGGLRMVTGLLGKRHPERVKVETPTATIGIRGTHVGLLTCRGDCADIQTISGSPPDDGLHIDVADGIASATNPVGELLIHAGQFGYVRDLGTPPTLVPTNRGIQVTMPSNISQNAADGRSVGPGNQSSECAAH